MRKLAYLISFFFIFTIPWETVFEDPVLGSTSRMAGLLLAACWLLSLFSAVRLRTPHSFHLLLGCFVIFTFASALWSNNPQTSVVQGLTWVQILLLSIILWDLYTSWTAVQIALQMYVLGSYVVVGDTVANYLAGQSYYYERFSAAGTHPDDLGLVLALALPAALYLALFWRPARFGFLTAINSIFIVAAFVGITLSGTRTALIAAIPGALFGLALLGRLKRKIALGVVVSLVVVGMIVVPLIPSSSFERLSNSGREATVGGDLNGRLELWQEGLQSFQRNPFIGIGSNMYRSTNLEGKVAHNSFISVLVELGLLGFVLFAMVIFSAIRIALHQPLWERRLWATLLITWVLGASMLTWEHRKPTWLLLNLIVISATAVVGAQPIPRENSIEPNESVAA